MATVMQVRGGDMADERVMTARGHITIVQEERFRLATTTGQSLLLTLAREAAADAADLCRFQASKVDVTVEYSGEPGLASGVARAVRAG